MGGFRVYLGSTRVVFLVGCFAFKIARFRPLRPMIRLIEHLRGGVVGEKLQKFDERTSCAVVKYLFAGIYANRTEYLYSRYTGYIPVAQVVRLYFGGLFLLQERGNPVDSENQSVLRHPMWLTMLEEKEGDPIAARAQFVLIRGEVRLADYGRSDLAQFFGA